MVVYNEERQRIGGFAIRTKAYMANPEIRRFEELVASNRDDRNEVIGGYFKWASEVDYETFRQLDWKRVKLKNDNRDIQFSVPIDYYRVVKDRTRRLGSKFVNVGTVVATFVSSYIHNNS